MRCKINYSTFRFLQLIYQFIRFWNIFTPCGLQFNEIQYHPIFLKSLLNKIEIFTFNCCLEVAYCHIEYNVLYVNLQNYSTKINNASKLQNRL